MHLVAEPEVLRSNFIGGVKHMPVEYTPGARRRAALVPPMPEHRPRACVPRSVRGSVRRMAADHDHEITIKGGSFDLSDLGHLLPGMAEIMPLVGERIWKCYYAAQAHNRKLAAFQLKEAVNLMQKGSILRPKYEEDMDAFIAGEVATLQANIEAEDWDAFETNFTTMVDQANAYHEKYDKSFLRWQLPADAAARPRPHGQLIRWRMRPSLAPLVFQAPLRVRFASTRGPSRPRVG